ncbi:EF-P 5-aminopentanol modification-associated protein YfmF [Lactococcus termiticola]|uniref:Peptidase M16 n=1 Tax=Lactococcus termiticola TaxID=2169526 RepID=A0A2R5HEK5_9LACT|nr:pitrilysin family protein [Lactococcus termiticola]GBG96462.1 peptidase M16 [Lactococcus termiticola]
MKLTEGVKLHIIPTKKFKTVRLMIRFRGLLTEETLAKRVLISNLWETSNQAYPTAQSFARRLSEMYGANFSTSVAKKGTQHLLTINMAFVNQAFIDEDSLAEAIAFVKSVIFEPDVDEEKAGRFNPAVFEREKRNLSHYLKAMNEDRGYYASRKLSSLFFSDKEQGLPGVANSELLEPETPESVYAYYQEMLAKDNIDIIVLGDVNEDEVVQQFQAFSFEGRKELTEVLYHQDPKALVSEVEDKEVAQSILQLAYLLPCSYGDEDYLTLQVMNGLLGGFAHSKLFMNVREKAQLAYSAGSTFDSFSGLLKIAIGIDASNYEQALSLTKAQVQAMADGDFTDDEVEQTKTMLRNSFYIGLDSAGNLLEMAYVEALVPERHIDDDEFLRRLDAVTKADVMKLASRLELQAQYFMRGAAYGEA